MTDLQKASISKRIAAALLDFILLTILVAGAAVLIAHIVNYDVQIDTIEARQKYYEEKFGISFSTTEEEYYNKLTDEQRKQYDDAINAFMHDKEFVRAYNMQVNLSLIIVTFSILFGILIVEFLIPLFLGNGQTLGKKVFSLGLVRTDGVQITKLQLFIRALLGKFVTETMIPVYIFLMLLFNVADFISLVILVALFCGQAICLILTRTNSAIHDLMAGTVAIDISSQQIFRSSEDLLEYTKKIHAERADRSGY